MTKAKILFTFLFLLYGKLILAQTYPVQVSTVIVPPYSLTLSDYSTTENLAVHVLFNDPIRVELAVKFKLTIEGRGITISTKPEFNPAPVYLQAGFAEQLSSTDLAPYFDPRNLNFQGLDRKEFEKKGTLPEGMYRFCVEVYEYSQNKKVSNNGCSTVWLILNDPPIINYPKNGEKIKIQDPQLVIFNWTPRHTGSPNAAFSTEYDFELVEVRANDHNPNNAILTSPPVYTGTTHATSLYYSLAETPLIPGQQYAFRVRARAVAGINDMDLFKNKGYSEVFTFTYGDYCTAPEAITVESLSATSVKATWSALPAHTAFTIRYKENKDKAAWFEKKSMVGEYTITNLKPATEYLVQVIGLCGVIANENPKNNPVTTNKADTSKFACGAPPDQVGSLSTELIKKLSPGDFIESSNFKVAVIEVTAEGETYTGRGIAYIPWFKLAGVKVSFTKIKVNKDKKVIAGNISSVQSDNSKWVYTVESKEEPVTETGTTTGTGNESGNTNTPTDTVKIGSGNTNTPVVIKSENPVITVNSSGGTTIVDGNQVIVVEKGQTATIVDSNGQEQTLVGGSTQPVASNGGGGVANGGSSNGGSGAGDGGQSNTPALPAESLQLLKDALTALRKKSDFGDLPQMKNNLDIKVSNIEGAKAKERERALTYTYAPVVESSNPLLVIKEEIIEIKEQVIDNDRFRLYKENVKAYNALKMLKVFCQENLSATQLNVMAARLSIDNKAFAVYASSAKDAGLTREKMLEDIGAAIQKLVKDQL